MTTLPPTPTRRREKARPANDSRFVSALLDTVGALILVLDRQGRVVRFNPECERVSGYTAGEMLGRPIWDRLLLEEEKAGVQATFSHLLAGNFPNRHENHWIHRDGGLRRIVWNNTALLDARGEVAYVVATGLDISERYAMETALRESEAKLKEITSELGDGIYVLGRGGVLTFMNKAAEKMLGWREEELLGRNAHDIFHFQRPDGSRVAACDCPVHHAMQSGQTYRVLEDWFTRKDGVMFPVSFVATPLHRGGEIIGSVAAFQDVSERKLAEERMRHLAHHDQLTGLPNRLLLAERLDALLERARRQHRRFALMFLDLDHFKEINDSLGHDAGDDLLIHVSGNLRECVRDTDTVARMGGDEFVILLADLTSKGDAEAVAGKILAALSHPVALVGEERKIGVSIGIALYPEHGGDARALMKSADIAMYEAKEGGRNGWRMSGAG